MSDDRLRSLERAARADPGEGAAGRALARAYELSGQRRRAHLEHALMARAGHADARAALDAWTPRPSPAGAVSRRPVIGEQARQRTTTLPGDVLTARPVASDERLVVPTRTRLIALDPVSLTEAWSAPGQAWPVTLRGDDVLHAGGAGLILRDGNDGAPLAELPLAGRVVELFVWGDRALVVHDAPGVRRVSALDVGERAGRTVWTHQWPTGAVDLVRPARHRLVLAGAQRIDVLDVETGRTTCGRGLVAGPRVPRRERVEHADARGAALVTADAEPASALVHVRVSELDLVRLEPRWEVQGRATGLEVVLGDGVAVLHLLQDVGESECVVVDRSTGASHVPAAPPPRGWLAWVDGGAYALAREATQVTLTVHDARTLERRARHELEVGPDLVDVDAVPFGRAVVVVAGHRDRTRLVRLESDA